MTFYIPDKGQVTVRYYGLYANAHRGKAKKASLSPSALRIVEAEFRRLPSKGWAAMICKVYEVDPMTYPKCGGAMKVVAFITEHAVVDRIIEHLKLTFIADKPPPPQAVFQEYLMAADPPRPSIFRDSRLTRKEKFGPFQALGSLPAAFRRAFLHSFLNLTSGNTPIYHSRRWDGVKSVLERSSAISRPARRKNEILIYLPGPH